MIVIANCSNCGMNNINGSCIAEELGYKPASAYQCDFFEPIDVEMAEVWERENCDLSKKQKNINDNLESVEE